MPWFANDRDKSIQATIDEWKIDIRHALNDIEGWRDNPVDKAKVEPWAPPMHLFGRTTTLVSCLGTEYPKLDPKPLLDLYDAVNAWYQDHDDNRVPPQAELESLADRAVMLVHVLERGIESRVVNEDPARKPLPKPTTTGDGITNIHFDLSEAVAYVDPGNTGAHFAAKLADIFSQAADEFPDFRYAEISGPCIEDDELVELVAACFVGAQTPYEYCIASAGGAMLFYGEDLDAGVATVRRHMNAISQLMTEMQRPRAMGLKPGEAGGEEVPEDERWVTLRSEHGPYIYAGAMVRTAPELAKHLKSAMAEVCSLDLTLGAIPEIHDGEPTVDSSGNVITFPGGVMATRIGDNRQWEKLKEAVRDRRIRVEYTLDPLFSVFYNATITLAALPGLSAYLQAILKAHMQTRPADATSPVAAPSATSSSAIPGESEISGAEFSRISGISPGHVSRLGKTMRLTASKAREMREKRDLRRKTKPESDEKANQERDGDRQSVTTTPAAKGSWKCPKGHTFKENYLVESCPQCGASKENCTYVRPSPRK